MILLLFFFRGDGLILSNDESKARLINYRKYRTDSDNVWFLFWRTDGERRKRQKAKKQRTQTKSHKTVVRQFQIFIRLEYIKHTYITNNTIIMKLILLRIVYLWTSSASCFIVSSAAFSYHPRSAPPSWFPQNSQKTRTSLANMAMYQHSKRISHESHKSRIIKNSVGSLMANRTDFEMAVMSAVVITIPITVLITLAVSGDAGESINTLFKEIGQDITSLSGGELTEDGMELLGDSIDIGTNIIEAAVPSSVTDLISLALGESIAGGIGALATYILQVTLRTKQSIQNKLQSVEEGRSASKQELFTDAVADTDFFIVRAAAIPLASALGVPTILGVLLATIPSQLVKISAKQKAQRKLEDEYLQALLNSQKLSNVVTPEKVGIANQADFVEIFADLTKWLSYNYLMKSFDGALAWPNGVPLGSGSESAVYGLIATTTSQVYADLLCIYSPYGSQDNRERATKRSFSDTARLYLNKGLSAAALFGVYETVRLPISNAISNFLSEGYDSCIGSEGFDLCLATYLQNNPAAADPQAQIRSAYVATTNLVERLYDGSLLGSNASAEALIRSFAVQVYSLVSQSF